jgi:hypothetical protein
MADALGDADLGVAAARRDDVARQADFRVDRAAASTAGDRVDDDVNGV